MNIYLIEQTVNSGYETYDSAVVCAENEDCAKLVHPSGDDSPNRWFSDWAASDDVKVTLIGIASHSTKEGVVCASFNAG